MENLVMRNTAEKLQTADEVWQKIESYEVVSLILNRWFTVKLRRCFTVILMIDKL